MVCTKSFAAEGDNWCLMLLKLFRVHLLTTLLTCFLKDRFVSVMHRYLTCVTDVMTSSLIKMSGLTELLILAVKCMQTGLLTLRLIKGGLQ